MPIDLDFVILFLIFINSLLILAILVLNLLVLLLLVSYAQDTNKELAALSKVCEEVARFVERAWLRTLRHITPD
jgi:hypothetical protein